MRADREVLLAGVDCTGGIFRWLFGLTCHRKVGMVPDKGTMMLSSTESRDISCFMYTSLGQDDTGPVYDISAYLYQLVLTGISSMQVRDDQRASTGFMLALNRSGVGYRMDHLSYPISRAMPVLIKVDTQPEMWLELAISSTCLYDLISRSLHSGTLRASLGTDGNRISHHTTAKAPPERCSVDGRCGTTERRVCVLI